MSAIEKVCPECGSAFLARSVQRIFCTERCRYRNRDSRPHRQEYDRRRHRERYVEDRVIHNRRTGPASNRAAFHGVPYEPIDRRDIFDRDGWTCQICGEAVDRDLAYPHPMSASVDHVTPWAKGGAHVPENVQCTHLVCNLKKGKKDVGEVAVDA